MLNDTLLIQVRDAALQARDAVEAAADYHRYTDGTNDLDEAYYDAQITRYNQLIAVINKMFEPVEIEKNPLSGG